MLSLDTHQPDGVCAHTQRKGMGSVVNDSLPILSHEQSAAA